MQKTHKSGFTIIEIVLVLTIAGLIFLMVFIGLPSLRRQQENHQRRDNIAHFMTAVQQYQAHNKGKLPFYKKNGTYYIDRNFVPRYVDQTCNTPKSDTRQMTLTGCKESMQDPDGTVYNMWYWSDWSDGQVGGKLTFYYHVGANENKFINHVVIIVTGAKCSGTDTNTWLRAEGTNKFGVIFFLEGNAIFCLDNS